MASAASVEIDGIYYKLSADTKQAKVTHGSSSYNSYTGSVVIPEKVKYEGVEYSVTSIGSEAFYYCSSLTSVTIPNSVTKIGVDAFHGCSGLTSVTIPNSVKNIETGAFHACDALASVTIGNGVTTIGWNAFASCSSLTSITIPASVTSIGSEAFDCKSLTSIKVEAGNTVYDSREDCNGIIETEFNRLIVGCQYTTIPNSVTSIGDRAFYCCDALASITIPNSVTTIGDQAFYYCDALTYVTIGNSVTSIAGSAFSYCWLLTDVYCLAKNIPETVTNAFDNSNIDKATLHVPKGSLEAYHATEPWSGFGKFVAEEESESLEISSAGQLPYYSQYNLDFTDKPELKAYVATGYNKITGTIWLTRVKQVPAETGFLLIGNEGVHDIPVVHGISDCYYKDMFKGTLEKITLQTTDDKYTNYYLSKGEYGVGFYKVKEGGVSLGANRAYLPIPDISTNGSAGDTEAIKISAAKQVPYFTSKNLDFTTMESQGVKAYTAIGYNYSTGTIWLSRVKQVPAQTGVLVIADEAGEYDIPTASVASVYENLFKGSEMAGTVYRGEMIDGIDYVNYYLSNGDYGVGFYKVTKWEGVPMSANRCYLQIPMRASSYARGESADTAPVMSNMILSDEGDGIIAIPVYGSTNGDADGTTNVGASLNDNGERIKEDIWYNLQGQRVDKPGKGIFIKNGKMVVIK